MPICATLRCDRDDFQGLDHEFPFAVDGLVVPHAAFRKQAVGGFIVHRPFMRMIRLVADPDRIDRAFDMGAVIGERFGHGLDQTGQVLLARARAGAGELLQHALIGHADDTGVHGVMPMVVAILFAIDTEHGVEPKATAQHRGHLSRNDAGAGAHQTEIFTCHPRQVAGVIERAGEEILVFAQPLRVAVFAEAVALVLGHQLGALQNRVEVVPWHGALAECLPWRRVALVAIGPTHRHRFVVQAVIERHRERQDVLDLHFVGQQHAEADRDAAIRALAIQRIAKVELFPQQHLLQIVAANLLLADAKLPGDQAAIALVAILIGSLALAFFVALLLALLQFPRDFDDDLGRMPVLANQRVHHFARLVQADMHGRVGNAAESLLGWIAFGGARVGKADIALQRLAVVGKLRQYLAGCGGAQIAVMLEACGDNGAVVGHHVARQFRQDARKRSAAQAAEALGQPDLRDAFGVCFINACVGHQPVHQRDFAFFGQDARDDLVLQVAVEVEPCLAEVGRLAQGGAGAVALEFRALHVFVCERSAAAQRQQLLQLRKRLLAVAFECINDLVALLQRQGNRFQPARQNAQVVRFLVNAESLHTRQCQWCSLLGGDQRAATGTHGFERALMQQNVFQFATDGFGEYRGIE